MAGAFLPPAERLPQLVGRVAVLVEVEIEIEVEVEVEVVVVVVERVWFERLLVQLAMGVLLSVGVALYQQRLSNLDQRHQTTSWPAVHPSHLQTMVLPFYPDALPAHRRFWFRPPHPVS